MIDVFPTLILPPVETSGYNMIDVLSVLIHDFVVNGKVSSLKGKNTEGCN
jgi:hypothetical protein